MYFPMLLKNNVCKKDIFCLIDKYSRVISRVEAEMLLEYLFNCARIDLYIRDFKVDKTIEKLYDSLVSRRMSGEPVQYITGRAEFMGLDFIVTKDVLIPRPETEILVSEIINSSRFPAREPLAGHSNNNKETKFSHLQYSSSGHESISREQSQEVKILDLCTGCGNIAVSLSKLMPQAEIVATDISEAALKIAEKNALRHDLSDRIKFYKGNLFNALIFATFARHRNNGGLSINTDIKQESVVKNPKFDIIVCNPPYIKEGELPYLQKEVKVEPEIALNGGRDGLDFYRVIAKESHRYLEKGGSILLEIGFGQKKGIENIFSSYNIFEIYKVIKDFSGIERAVCLKTLT
ncbi:MAG: protein-(glutamine-N5) methyltransferase, release factor-specific [Candidatus Omnitrophica bacterium CG1_02_40_15]|nr:MAG: protein-(glutamine-N5) methyltransferase, release factor-specific [Candidatus Omnitrophica bacterium CG1_02_40_15]